MKARAVRFARRSPAVAVAMAVLAAAPGAAPAGAAERPGLEESQAFIGKLVDDAVRTWAMHPSDEAAALKAMDALVHSAFDVDFITRAVLGRYWRTIDPAEQRRFREVFPEFVVEVYLPHIAKYDRDHLRVLGARPVGKRDVLVRSEILTDDGSWIEGDWRVRSGEAGLRILDLTVAGVSLLLVQREEFESVIRRHGFATLIERLIERRNRAASSRG